MIYSNEFYSSLKSKTASTFFEKRCLTNHAEHVVENWQDAPFVQNAESQ